MTREEKCKLAIERGFIYDPETGLIYSRYKKIVNRRIRNYISINLTLNKKTYNLKGHHFAWYWVNKKCVKEIDHINGVHNDNRICNLRSVTHQQNNWNRINAKGYSWNKASKKWMAKIRLNSKDIYLGYYNCEQEARNAYLAAKEIYHKI